ncbi:Transcription factor MYC/MYB N-terminal protein [Dioscorea alata]|uniref:Transcription factor MYC/MYB N-terminal protein n=1 Tax=Dioscorea alata TaxID=55571 RepID=A0ACB7UQR2_DIOAL|nr:Transcription factor MYC/MYB N-terminal protein [Dioscorea alata]
MDVGFECQEDEIQGNFRKQLAAVVKTLQWCYAIFWAHSSCQKGLLVWSDGYYNGDIKTRKTTQPMELQADQLGMQRSEQLRELYESLSAGESSPPARRPSASLSPEDLTDTEWYYLVCMSFTFTSEDGIPGKILDDNQPIWLNNAQFADSQTFSRSLLAKSASIQTVVCFPFMDGILELGSTEMVPKDPDLAQQIITSFWQFTNPVISEQSISSPQLDDDLVDADFDHDDVDTRALEYPDVSECLTPNQNELRTSSLSDSIDEYLQNQDFENQHLMDNECSNADCICIPVDFATNGTHYTKTLAAILGNPKQQEGITPSLHENIPKSSFKIWRGASTSQATLSVIPQKMLKKMIVNVSWKSSLQNGIHQTEGDDASASHMLSERRRREKLNEKFIILRSLVPSISKYDKASILGDTIEYLKELERRVEELESCRELMDAEVRERPKHPDVSERTSDNYGAQNASKKRKACIVDEPETEQHHWVLSKDGPVDVNVTLMQKDVVIEMHCPWRDSLLFDIIEAMNNLDLDSHSLQSNTEDGILAMTAKAKIKGTVSASAGTIRKALHKVLAKS